MDEETGCKTRSKVRALDGERPESTHDAQRRPSSVAPSTSRTSRSSSETLRLRAEYEAEKELAKVKEELIKKKLALEIAEIEDAESTEARSVGGYDVIDEWIARSDAAAKGHVIGKCPRAPSDGDTAMRATYMESREPASHERRDHPDTCTHHDSRDPDPCVRHVSRKLPAPHASAASARIASLAPPAPPTDPRTEIKYLADVIASGMSRHLELPEFDGSPVEWLSFRSAYEKTAGKYDAYENTLRLRRALRGEARFAVEDLLRTGTDPSDVIRALEEDFGHPNFLLEAALRKVRSLPRVSDDGVELRCMMSGVRNCVYILRNIKAHGYLNNPQIAQEILGKLTPVQRARYGEYVMKTRTSDACEDLRISPNLCVILEYLEYLVRSTSYYMPAPPAESAAAAGPVGRVHASVHVEPRRNPESTCVLCSGDHLLPECDEFVRINEKEKWDFVKENKLCFKCLVKDHSRYRCSAKRCIKCRAPHHTLLHYERSPPAAPRPAAGSAVEIAAGPRPTGGAEAARPAAARVLARPAHASSEDVSVTSESVTITGERFTKTLLKIIPIHLVINDIDYACYALLDDGATVSLMDSRLCNNLCGPSSPLKIVSASGHIVTDNNSRRVTALIRGPNGVTHDISLRTIRNLDLPSQNVPAKVFQNVHLRDLDFCELSCAKPLVLIGQDNWELIVNDEIRQGKSGQPVASRTKLGWVVHGPCGGTSEFVHQSLVSVISECDDNLHDLVKQQFELESIGISEVSRKNVETERALRILESTSRRIDGSWEVGLLWSRDDVYLPDNYDYALKRLHGIESKMNKDSSYADAYTRQIDRLVAEKYCRRVDNAEPIRADRVWWLPHFGVTNPNKPGKLRLVYDAAAKYQGTCLNDHLLSGPDLLNSLLGILFKFRSGPVAYSADISDMFLRIKIRKKDQGAQLFLWRGQDKTREPDTYVMNSMIFGAKSSPTSAIFILNKNANEFRDRYPDAVKAISDNHYMDDYLQSVFSVDVARQLIADVSLIHAAGGFSIRGWVTNSPELRRELPTVVPGKVNFDKSPYSGERTLGMIWIPELDELAFDLSFKRLSPNIVEGRVVPTKREFLRFIMSIFDPLGFLAPYIIKSKILLQKVWKSNVGWDERLKDKENDEWRKWLQDIKRLSEMRVPRWYGISFDYELHVFGDASELAYAAVAFLVGKDEVGQSVVAMVVGKARVAPLKVISIPRLELQAAVLACRLAVAVEKEQGLAIIRRHLWSDSKTVLKWINSDPRDFQKYVSHRLAEIDRKSNVSEWRWVPSAENPADEATKLTWPTNCKLWLSGPDFLRKPKDQWPICEHDDSGDADLEQLEKVHAVSQWEPLINLDRFSSWIRAVRATARVFAFVEICRKKQSEYLSVENMRSAELFLIRQSQTATYSHEIKLLKSGNSVPPNSKIRNLDPMLYDDLLRVRGRLIEAPGLTFDEKHPIILDGRNRAVRLLILDYHKRAHHANTDTVMNCIRERFWITQLRRSVKAAASECQFCRVRRALPLPPKMGDLPSARLENTRRAFVNCGVDYFGPMDVAIGRRHEKRWGVLFTCLVTRAVHLELASSLSADSAIMAIRRFIARRGQPSIMFSDRGTNFVGADAELRSAVRSLEQDKLYDFAITRGISWQFNPAAAPHMGGCWERLVRSVKTALRVTLKERVPKEETLLTLLAEVELTINSRPLTQVGIEPDGPVVLTPNHLLIGTASGASTLGSFDATDLNRRKAWKKAQALADMFWRRWLREYVPTLQKRQKWLNNVPPVKVGDAVLIYDANQPRNTWPRGVISAVHPGRDGQVRVVTVKTNKGFVKRPVVKIVILPTDDVCV